jgi:flagellar protein FliO/FliZ
MTSAGWTSLLWFAAIVALIPAALWLLKRTPIGAFGGASGQPLLRNVAQLPLSPSQRIVTVEVGQGESRRWLVLGVTPNSIRTLHTMEPQSDLSPLAAAPALTTFAQLLGRLRDGKGAAGGH